MLLPSILGYSGDGSHGLMGAGYSGDDKNKGAGGNNRKGGQVAPL
jgi:hypothetical protein